ncbi:hypothetical protein C449_06266 [Halococcus saccharolyticus DSM 5350]|uniref:Uncharacterized protein n=1 Tax=Halococcus saccharolyticus DSM 5350 TaxID=1227455 RepID=M0MKD5_9EURY|nr:hypothetical protein C449_06266 [Halococcus saccharolyticus DSM 5350]
MSVPKATEEIEMGQRIRTDGSRDTIEPADDDRSN